MGKKISALASVSSVNATDMLEVSVGAESKSATAQVLADFVSNAPALTTPRIVSTTWALRPTAGTAGRIAFISDAGAKGSFWYDDGTRWKPMNGSAVLASLDSASANIANSETVVFQYLIPAGLWQVGDKLRIYGYFTKSGTTDTCGVRIRIGTAGTTGDTQFINTTLLNAASRQSSNIWEIRLESATTAIFAASNGGGYGAANTSNTPGTAVTISSAVANALYVNVTVASSSTNDTVALANATLEIVSKAN